MSIKEEIGELAQRVVPGVTAGTLGVYTITTAQVTEWLTIAVLVLTAAGYVVKMVMDFRKDRRSERALALMRERAMRDTQTAALIALEDFDKKQDEA